MSQVRLRWSGAIGEVSHGRFGLVSLKVPNRHLNVLFGDAGPRTIVCMDPPDRAKFVRQNYRPERVQWARTATKHRISRERSRYVLERATVCFVLNAQEGGRAKLAFLGDDAGGTPLEVIAVELGGGAMVVIHAMKLRKKFTGMYWEAKYGI